MAIGVPVVIVGGFFVLPIHIDPMAIGILFGTFIHFSGPIIIFVFLSVGLILGILSLKVRSNKLFSAIGIISNIIGIKLIFIFINWCSTVK